jgi:hypothetical protein
VRALSSSLEARVARLESDGAAEIRSEMATLRTLALGRSSFPVPPSPAIPAWQRVDKDRDTTSAAAPPTGPGVSGASDAPGRGTAVAMALARAEIDGDGTAAVTNEGDNEGSEAGGKAGDGKDDAQSLSD